MLCERGIDDLERQLGTVTAPATHLNARSMAFVSERDHIISESKTANNAFSKSNYDLALVVNSARVEIKGKPDVQTQIYLRDVTVVTSRFATLESADHHRPQCEHARGQCPFGVH